MAINKIIYDNTTLIDLTNDTVSPEALDAGVTAHSASGELITGTKSVFNKFVITDASYLFSGQIPEEATKLFTIDKPTLMNHMYYFNDAIKDIDMTILDYTPNPKSIPLNNMFYNCDTLLSVKLPPNIKAKSLAAMFQGCKKLVSFDLNNVDVSECTDYRSFINSCAELTEFDGSIFPSLKVANNNCQNFFCGTLKMKKIWLPKEWIMPNTTAGYSAFISNGGSNKMNADLQIFTDATSEDDQITAKHWTKYTMTYNSSGTKIPDDQIHYNATHDDYVVYGLSLFNINNCEFEENIISHSSIGLLDCTFTTNGILDHGCVWFVVDPLKTYNISWNSINCGLSGYNSDWSSIVFTEEGSDGAHLISRVTDVQYLYFYVFGSSASHTGTFTDVIIKEV